MKELLVFVVLQRSLQTGILLRYTVRFIDIDGPIVGNDFQPVKNSESVVTRFSQASRECRIMGFASTIGWITDEKAKKIKNTRKSKREVSIELNGDSRPTTVWQCADCQKTGIEDSDKMQFSLRL